MSPVTPDILPRGSSSVPELSSLGLCAWAPPCADALGPGGAGRVPAAASRPALVRCGEKPGVSASFARLEGLAVVRHVGY